MFLRNRKHQTTRSYDPSVFSPALRCSICTGEQVAGFRNLADGSFEEIMLIRGQTDLDAFREQYGIEGEITKIY